MPRAKRVELPSSFDLTFTEAEEFFTDKVALTRAEFDELRDWAKLRAFTVARVTQMEVLDDLHQSVLKAISEGTTIEQFRADVGEIMEARGWAGLTPWHVDTVFRSNIQTAFAAGQIAQNRAVADEFPYWMYSAINDHRVRPSHLELDNRVYPADHSFWKTHYPPWEFNCRCDVIPLDAEAAEGMRIWTEPGPEPEGSFTSPGALLDYEPDLERKFGPSKAAQVRDVLSTFDSEAIEDGGPAKASRKARSRGRT